MGYSINAFVARLSKSLGFRLSRLGERIGVQALIYNPRILREFHEHAVREAPLVVNAINNLYPHAKRILDVGSGSGAFAAEFRKRGSDIMAVEHSRYGRKLAARQGIECLPFDLTASPPSSVVGPFDLVYSFEVAEHITPFLGSRLVEFIVSFKSEVVFTAAHPGQGGIGHINEQPLAYWVSEFHRHNYGYDEIRSKILSERFRSAGAAFWFVDNVAIFSPILGRPEGNDNQ